jgi:aspartyl protease family protein
MRSVLVFAALALVASLSVPRYVAQIRQTEAAPKAIVAPPQPAAAQPADSNSVVIPRGSNGHFDVEGRVDGRFMQFMVDTGATVVALTEHDAAMLGIHPAESDYTAMVRTANGSVRAAPVKLDMIEVGDLVVRDVDAVVLPDSALADNLLGLSFLSRLRHFEYGEGKLVLEQ